MNENVRNLSESSLRKFTEITTNLSFTTMQRDHVMILQQYPCFIVDYPHMHPARREDFKLVRSIGKIDVSQDGFGDIGKHMNGFLAIVHQQENDSSDNNNNSGSSSGKEVDKAKTKAKTSNATAVAATEEQEEKKKKGVDLTIYFMKDKMKESESMMKRVIPVSSDIKLLSVSSDHGYILYTDYGKRKINVSKIDGFSFPTTAVFSLPDNLTHIARSSVTHFIATKSLIVIVIDRVFKDGGSKEYVFVYDLIENELIRYRAMSELLPRFHSGFENDKSPLRVSCVDVHKDYQQILFGTSRGEVVYYSNIRNKQPTVLHWHAHRVSTVKFFGISCFLSGGRESVLVMWHLGTLQKTFLPRLGGNGILSIDSKDENIIVLLQSYSLLVIDSLAWAVTRRTIPYPPDPNPICHVVNQHKIVPISFSRVSKTIELILPSGRTLNVSQRTHISSARHFPRLVHIASSFFSPNESSSKITQPISFLATVDFNQGNVFSGKRESNLKFWSNMQELTTSEIERDITALSGARDSPCFAVAHGNGNIKIWRSYPERDPPIYSFSCIASFSHVENDRISKIAISPDASCVATLIPENDLVEIWRITNVYGDLESALPIYEHIHSISLSLGVKSTKQEMNKKEKHVHTDDCDHDHEHDHENDSKDSDSDDESSDYHRYAPPRESISFFGAHGEKIIIFHNSRVTVFDLTRLEISCEISDVLAVSTNQVNSVIVLSSPQASELKGRSTSMNALWLNQNIDVASVSTITAEIDPKMSLWLLDNGVAILQTGLASKETRVNHVMITKPESGKTIKESTVADDIIDEQNETHISTHNISTLPKAKRLEIIANSFGKEMEIASQNKNETVRQVPKHVKKSVELLSHELPSLETIFGDAVNQPSKRRKTSVGGEADEESAMISATADAANDAVKASAESQLPIIKKKKQVKLSIGALTNQLEKEKTYENDLLSLFLPSTANTTTTDEDN